MTMLEQEKAHIEAIRARSKLRGRVAICVTLIWLVLCGLFAFDLGGWNSLTLNTLGDFLAGITAPLAFLWLVVGYFQQGSELQISSHTLLLQAHELEKTVQEQAKLVKVAQDELDLMYEERSRAIRPNIMFINNVVSPAQNSGQNLVNIQLSNEGPGGAYDLNVLNSNVHNGAGRVVLRPNVNHEIDLIAQKNAQSIDVQIRYTDEAGVRFELTAQGNLAGGIYHFGRPHLQRVPG